MRRALGAWKDAAQLELLGSLTANRLPVFSFRVRNGRGGFVHQQLVTRMLSDRFGIQARGGCACAGPYVHRLLDIGEEQSLLMRQAILDGREIEKPGFVRLNFSALLSDAKADFILASVLELASDAADFEGLYDFDPSRAIFFPKTPRWPPRPDPSFCAPRARVLGVALGRAPRPESLRAPASHRPARVNTIR